MQSQDNLDSAAQIRELAMSFAKMSEGIEAYYQLHCETLSKADQEALLAQAQRLDDIQDSLTAEAVEATLRPLKGDLQRITAVTHMASEALGRLRRFASVARLAATAAKLGAAIVTGDLGAIPQTVTDLVTSSQEPDQEGDHP